MSADHMFVLQPRPIALNAAIGTYYNVRPSDRLSVAQCTVHYA